MNRLAVIAVSAVIALASGFGLVSYVGAADDRAAAAAEPVPVLVATADLPDGTAFDEALADGRIAPSRTLRSTLAPTAVTDPSSLEGIVSFCRPAASPHDVATNRQSRTGNRIASMASEAVCRAAMGSGCYPPSVRRSGIVVPAGRNMPAERVCRAWPATWRQ